MDQPSIVIQSLPAITGLIGACVGFAGSFLNTLYNQKQTHKQSHNQRKRERIESLYRLIEVTRYEIQRDQKNTILAANGHHSEIEHSATIEGKLPAFIEIEMLIDLYLPILKEGYQNFDKARSEFKAICFRLADEPMQSKSAEEQRADVNELRWYFENVQGELYKLQAMLPELIES